MIFLVEGVSVGSYIHNVKLCPVPASQRLSCQSRNNTADATVKASHMLASEILISAVGLAWNMGSTEG